jgi:mannose-P-dolichol utilization defect protein 1
MTAITQNLPWFVKDLGISIVGEVCFLYSNIDEESSQVLVLGMLHVTG